MLMVELTSLYFSRTFRCKVSNVQCLPVRYAQIQLRLKYGELDLTVGGPSGRARSNAWVCGRSLAGIAGSNSAGSMDVCLL